MKRKRINTCVKNSAIVFDFDGTLIYGGRGGQDKGIHLMYSSWVACYESGFQEFLHLDALREDIDRLLRAYLKFHGAPRFQQLTVFLNALINNIPDAVDDPKALNLSRELQSRYQDVRETYNRVYSALNDAAAQKYWRPFRSVKDTLRALAQDYDLYIASGLPQNLLEEDFTHYDFDPALFVGMFGSDAHGASDKGTLLKKIKAFGYEEMLFIGDSTTDLEYASQAKANFFRIKEDSDYQRLLNILSERMPDEQQPWTFTKDGIEWFEKATTYLLEAYNSGNPMSPEAITDFINNQQ